MRLVSSMLIALAVSALAASAEEKKIASPEAPLRFFLTFVAEEGVSVFQDEMTGFRVIVPKGFRMESEKAEPGKLAAEVLLKHPEKPLAVLYRADEFEIPKGMTAEEAITDEPVAVQMRSWLRTRVRGIDTSKIPIDLPPFDRVEERGADMLAQATYDVAGGAYNSETTIMLFVLPRTRVTLTVMSHASTKNLADASRFSFLVTESYRVRPVRQPSPKTFNP